MCISTRPDRYCLDGQRLVAISGTYGADGAEYRTEADTFVKVVSRGTAGSGPERFEVWTKSGQKMDYGNTADSRVEAVGRTDVRLWGVDRITDSAGNYLTVSYREESDAPRRADGVHGRNPTSSVRREACAAGD